MATIDNDINTWLDELVEIIEATLPNSWSKVYGFRAAPEKFRRYASVFYMGGEQQGGYQTTADSTPRADFHIVLFAQFDLTEESQEEAERDLNNAESLLINAITEDRSKSWLKAIVPYPTIRPRQPRSMPETRMAEIPFRLFTK
jgi:hypothetical protein